MASEEEESIAIFWRFTQWLLLLAIVGFMGHVLLGSAKASVVARHFDWQLFAIAIVYHVLQFVLDSYQLYFIFRLFKPKLSLRACAEAFLTAKFLHPFFPRAQSGYQFSPLNTLYKIPPVNYVAGFLYYYFISLLLNAWYSVVFLVVVDPDITLSGLRVVRLLLPAALLCSIFLTLCQGLVQSNRVPLHVKGTRNVSHTFFELYRRTRLLGAIAFGSVAQYILGICFEYLCFWHLYIEVTWGQVAVFRLAKSFVGIFEITPGNFGITEMIYGFLARPMRIPVTSGILVSLFYSVTSIVSIALMFAVYRYLSARRASNAVEGE